MISLFPAALLGLSLSASAPSASAPAPAVPFLEDDLPRAQALARSKKLPIFVEAWAPW